MKKPHVFDDDRIVSLTLVDGIGTIHRCMTIAQSLDEAYKRAKEHYGQPVLTINAWGTRRLPVESRLIGGGYFLRSSRDELHKSSLAFINSYLNAKK
jgi:hypothetical protein